MFMNDLPVFTVWGLAGQVRCHGAYLRDSRIRLDLKVERPSVKQCGRHRNLHLGRDCFQRLCVYLCFFMCFLTVILTFGYFLQTLRSQFSAVSKPNFASKYSFEQLSRLKALDEIYKICTLVDRAASVFSLEFAPPFEKTKNRCQSVKTKSVSNLKLEKTQLWA